jgi:hypothetical protein
MQRPFNPSEQLVERDAVAGLRAKNEDALAGHRTLREHDRPNGSDQLAESSSRIEAASISCTRAASGLSQ